MSKKDEMINYKNNNNNNDNDDGAFHKGKKYIYIYSISYKCASKQAMKI
jgi:hypothetical protein